MKILPLLAFAASGFLLSGCHEDYHGSHHRHDGYYGHDRGYREDGYRTSRYDGDRRGGVVISREREVYRPTTTRRVEVSY